ncbi:hypothetical protein B0H16DRAFT_1749511 [Mycena metata]|uniref:Uncharacterized protein n=1 Tax=Mycena metata TaxID=1033252 RepID=A0AAD7DVZ4_9AGAR|nr:hypothetical protein B0H16DRAFT_1749511 [Mycena metata]
MHAEFYSLSLDALWIESTNSKPPPLKNQIVSSRHVTLQDPLFATQLAILPLYPVIAQGQLSKSYLPRSLRFCTYDSCLAPPTLFETCTKDSGLVLQKRHRRISSTGCEEQPEDHSLHKHTSPPYIMRVSTFFPALFTIALAAQANAAAVNPRADIHDLTSFRAASHADQKAFLLQINPTNLQLSDVELQTIAQEPKVSAKLNGAQLTLDEVRAWLVRWDKKHGKN